VAKAGSSEEAKKISYSAMNGIRKKEHKTITEEKGSAQGKKEKVTTEGPVR